MMLVALEIGREIAARLESLRPLLQRLSSVVGHDHYKYCTTWYITMQHVVGLCALSVYLQHETAITIEQVEHMLQVQVDTKGDTDTFHISLEEYLHALISLVNELSRLAVNAVTAGDFQRPLRISAFVKELFAGFQMLNLKNDSLRRRFDSLKYDLKKVEEVVYDLSIRGLTRSA
jgi:predicted translin family RNA/ssDNA-binding protein